VRTLQKAIRTPIGDAAEIGKRDLRIFLQGTLRCDA
jgi:hypothetical protein